MTNAIEITNLFKRYPGAEVDAVQGLTLSFPKGIIAGLLGPNGAGKTTTISILCGLVNLDSGIVKVLGFDSQEEILEIKKRIGIIPQQIALYPQLTAIENFLYIGRLYGISDKKLKVKIKELLHKFGLSEHGSKKIIQYSGGMKRRANIIAGLLHDPEILILDEPTAGVDVQSRAMILDFLREYNESGKTIIYTSHYLEEAEKICHEVAIIDEGKLIALDSPSELVKKAVDCRNLEDVFLYYTGRSVRS